MPLPVAADQPIAGVLAERAGSGVNVRICLCNSSAPAAAQGFVGPRDAGASAVNLREALAIYTPLREKGDVDIRLQRAEGSDMVAAYVDAFEIAWAAARLPA